MKIRFTHRSFSGVAATILEQANAILESYTAEGYKMTLRQLYYQFVAQDKFPDAWAVEVSPGQFTKNHERNYKKLGNLITEGRMAGIINWSHIEDRTRSLETWRKYATVRDALDDCADGYALDMWANQPCAVEVWVEKEALAGVISDICSPWQVPYFACRGYVSASAAYAAYQRAYSRFIDFNQATLVLHLGDHDPSGVDMSRDNMARVSDMLSSDGAEAYDKFALRRLALNMDQITGRDLPPSPAKATDSRAKDYVEKFGKDSWELDALPPAELKTLVDGAINRFVDHDQWAKDTDQQRADRKHLRTLI